MDKIPPLSQEFFDFIDKNKNIDVLSLYLNSKNKSSETDFAILQIESRKKHKEKLARFLQEREFLFPDKLSGEQASHQAVAAYHAYLFGKNVSLLDMTAGLGIDVMTAAPDFKEVTAIELDPGRYEALQHNSNVLHLNNITCINGDSVDFLKSTDKNFDIIFIDPARRDSSNKRLYGLKDCLPDVTALQDLMITKSRRIFIKASPMLDITKVISELKNICSISAIGVKGECKEILIEIDSLQATNTPNAGLSSSSDIQKSAITLNSVNLDIEGNIINSFSKPYLPEHKQEIRYCSSDMVKPGSFILEPSAMTMKIAPWESISNSFNACKLDKSSHLFISEEKPVGFPGRVSFVKGIINKENRKSLERLPASVISRNHPLSADELRKKLKLKEGDSIFIYATRIDGRPMLIQSLSLSESVS